MVAPVWRFALPPGCCGAGAAVGLWLPSIDRAGRLFPLTIALVGRNWQDVGSSLQFLDRVEAIGIGAVEEDVEPGALGAAVAHAAALGGDPVAPPAGVSRWWTAGSPLVAASTRELRAMPDGNEFTAMLRDAGES
jgi:type VI secretion system protein ImpM